MPSTFSRNKLSSRNRSTKALLQKHAGTLVFCALVIVAVIRFFDMTDPDLSTISFPIPNPSHKRAMVLLSMGDKALHCTMVERFYWSARTIGKYDGWIIVLTDHPQWRYQKLWQPGNGQVDDKFVVFHTSLHEGMADPINYEPTEDRHCFKHEAMKYKVYKTYVLEYMSRDKRLDDVDLVYYLDVDIVFAKEVEPMFEELERTYHISPDPSATKVWMFEGTHWPNGTLNKIPQGGQMILNRGNSQVCLNEWRQKMFENNGDKFDQFAMGKLIDDESRQCNFVTMLRKNIITFPESWDIEARVTSLMIGNATRNYYTPMIHFRNTGRVIVRTDANNLTMYLRDLLRFTPGQKDDLGLLERCQMASHKYARDLKGEKEKLDKNCAKGVKESA